MKKLLERLFKVAVDLESLVERNGILYRFDGATPYSGRAKSMHDSRNLFFLAQFKNGKKDGLSTIWHENGQKAQKALYKNGKRDGLWTLWHENGQKASEAIYKDGKEDGPYPMWHADGQKALEATFVEGQEEGLHTAWYNNGQKRFEESFEDGSKVSANYWNSSGEPVATLEETEQDPCHRVACPQLTIPDISLTTLSS